MGSGWGSQHGNGGVLQESLCWASAVDQEGCSAPNPITAMTGCLSVLTSSCSDCWLVTPQPHGTGCPSWPFHQRMVLQFQVLHHDETCFL